MLNLDTHICLAAFDDKLRRDERELLEQERWGISAIVFWEIARLHRAGRIKVGLGDAHLDGFLRQLRVWPVSSVVAEATYRLDFELDPADELIAATSLVHGAPLLTRDSRLLTSKVVPLALK